jgi:hypothetical protein
MPLAEGFTETSPTAAERRIYALRLEYAMIMNINGLPLSLATTTQIR